VDNNKSLNTGLDFKLLVQLKKFLAAPFKKAYTHRKHATL